MADYWTVPLPEQQRRSTTLFSLSKPFGPMQVVARSRVGGQLLGRLPSGQLAFFVLKEQQWQPVGGVLCVGEEQVPLIAHGIVGASITRSNGICVLFQNDAMAVTTANDVFHGRAAAWSGNAERIATVRDMIVQRYALVMQHADPPPGGEYLCDFITVRDVVPPLCIKKFTGRPKFSADRTTRPFRSKALPASEEANCMFALIACLWTMYPPPGIETSWIVDTTLMRLFSETRAAKVHSSCVYTAGSVGTEASVCV